MTAVAGRSAGGLAERAGVLRGLHGGLRPVVLPNAWDVASARLVVKAGFPVVATSSGAVSATLGYEDDGSMPVDEAFGLVARIARSVSVPVTADVEGGYRLPPTELVERLLDAGAVGCNLEDTDHHGGAGLLDADEHAERFSGVRGRGVVRCNDPAGETAATHFAIAPDHQDGRGGLSEPDRSPSANKNGNSSRFVGASREIG